MLGMAEGTGELGKNCRGPAGYRISTLGGLVGGGGVVERGGEGLVRTTALGTVVVRTWGGEGEDGIRDTAWAVVLGGGVVVLLFRPLLEFPFFLFSPGIDFCGFDVRCGIRCGTGKDDGNTGGIVVFDFSSIDSEVP